MESKLVKYALCLKALAHRVTTTPLVDMRNLTPMSMSRNENGCTVVDMIVFCRSAAQGGET